MTISRLTSRPLRRKWSRLFPETMTPESCVPTFGDMSPFMLITTSSLEDLRKRMQQVDGGNNIKLDVVRFRPSVVIKTDEDQPYQAKKDLIG